MKMSSAYQSLSAVTSAVCSKPSLKSSAATGEIGDPIAVPSISLKNWSPYMKYSHIVLTLVRVLSMSTPVVVSWRSFH